MKKQRILIADDETHILHVVSLKLGNAGYEVLTARDGQEALDMVLADPPDLLITDFHMPELSGIELCERIREQPHLQKLPAIMLTARGYNLEPQDMEHCGILMMISKPFSPRKLLTTVAEVLHQAA